MGSEARSWRKLGEGRGLGRAEQSSSTNFAQGPVRSERAESKAINPHLPCRFPRSLCPHSLSMGPEDQSGGSLPLILQTTVYYRGAPVSWTTEEVAPKSCRCLPWCTRGVQLESWEHWPLGYKWEEAEVKKMKVPKGSEGRERMLEASAAEDFKKEVANRISMAKQSKMQICQMVNHRDCW